MYIFEIFVKWLNKNKRGCGANPDGVLKETYTPEEDEAINCDHKFMPIDSSGNVLACTKCGFVVKKNEKYRG